MGIKLFQDPPLDDELANEDGVLSVEWEKWVLDLKNVQTEIVAIDAVIDPASVAANSSATLSATITQVIDEDGNTRTLGSEVSVFTLGDYVLQLIKPTLTEGIIIGSSRITGTNTIDIDFTNVTGGNINPASETYTIIVLKG